MRKGIILIAIMILSGYMYSQTPMDALLEIIGQNNKSIKTSQGQVEANNIRQKTGIFLPNPTIEYNYMTGTPSEVGNKTDFGVTQSFDFPSVYILQNKIAGLHGNANQFMLLSKRQEVLRQAAELYTELVFINKYAKLLKRLQNTTNQFVSGLKTKFELGAIDAMEYSQKKWLESVLLVKIRQNELRKQTLTKQLTGLNGGIPLAVNDTVYPSLEPLPVLDTVINRILVRNPDLNFIQGQQSIREKEIQLAKSRWLPKFEAGYYSESTLMSELKGLHLGMSIPLWENANTVKRTKSEARLINLQWEEYRNGLYYEVSSLYEQWNMSQVSLEEIRTGIVAIDFNMYLNILLKEGKIEASRFFYDLSGWLAINEMYLSGELDMNLAYIRLKSHNF
jgi:cobalt-zinc-cadmium efflux system outer membrane protein